MSHTKGKTGKSINKISTAKYNRTNAKYLQYKLWNTLLAQRYILMVRVLSLNLLKGYASFTPNSKMIAFFFSKWIGIINTGHLTKNLMNKKPFHQLLTSSAKPLIVASVVDTKKTVHSHLCRLNGETGSSSTISSYSSSTRTTWWYWQLSSTVTKLAPTTRSWGYLPTLTQLESQPKSKMVQRDNSSSYNMLNLWSSWAGYKIRFVLP